MPEVTDFFCREQWNDSPALMPVRDIFVEGVIMNWGPPVIPVRYYLLLLRLERKLLGKLHFKVIDLQRTPTVTRTATRTVTMNQETRMRVRRKERSGQRRSGQRRSRWRRRRRSKSNLVMMMMLCSISQVNIHHIQ